VPNATERCFFKKNPIENSYRFEILYLKSENPFLLADQTIEQN